MSTPANAKLPLSKSEAKSDTTTRVAREIIDGEAARRDAKTDRLKAARLAREAAEESAPQPTLKKPKAKSKAPAKTDAKAKTGKASTATGAKKAAAKRKSADA